MGKARSAVVPELPNVSEQGYPDQEAYGTACSDRSACRARSQ
jgi:hypothetical protein